MAQLRHDYPKFATFHAEVLVVVPNGTKMIARHVDRNAPPYPILSDKGARVAASFAIDTRNVILLQAFTPTVFVIDTTGVIQYASYGSSYIEEPDNREPLAVLARLHNESSPEQKPESP
jgi:peroxiredoxin